MSSARDRRTPEHQPGRRQADIGSVWLKNIAYVVTIAAAVVGIVLAFGAHDRRIAVLETRAAQTDVAVQKSENRLAQILDLLVVMKEDLATIKGVLGVKQ